MKLMKHMRFSKKWIYCICIVLCFLFIASIPTQASGGSWIDKSDERYTTIYGLPEDAPMINDTINNDALHHVGPFEAMIASPLCTLGARCYKLFNSGNISLSIDGIVYGRMHKGVSVSYTKFDLSAGNPWGIIGSYFYVFSRKFVLTVVIVVFSGLLMTHLLKHTSQDRDDLKKLIKNTLFAFLLIYTMPMIVELLQYILDVFLYSVTIWLEGLIDEFEIPYDPDAFDAFVAAVDELFLTKEEMFDAVRALVLNFNSDGLVEIFYTYYQDQPSIANALFFDAAVFAGLFFFGEYVRIAFLLTFMFGFLPIIALMSLWNSKILEEWAKIFFPNLLIPVIDGILLFIPNLLFQVYIRTVKGSAFVILAIVIICIWAIIPTRNNIMRMFGYVGFTGSHGRGFGGMLLGAGMMLARNLISGATGGRGGSGHGADDSISADDAATVQGSIKETMAEADNHMGLPELDDYERIEAPDRYENDTDNFLNSFGPDESVMASQGMEQMTEPIQEDVVTSMDSAVPDTMDMDKELGELDEPATGTATDAAVYTGADIGDVDYGSVEPSLRDGTDGVPPLSTDTATSSPVDGGATVSTSDTDTLADVTSTTGSNVPTSTTVSAPETQTTATATGSDGGVGATSEYTAKDMERRNDLSKFRGDTSRKVSVNRLEAKGDMSFYKELGKESSRDAQRYGNLVQRDALKDKIAQNEQEIRKGGFHNGFDMDTYNKKRQEQVDRNVRLGHQSDVLDKQIKDNAPRLEELKKRSEELNTRMEGNPANAGALKAESEQVSAQIKKIEGLQERKRDIDKRYERGVERIKDMDNAYVLSKENSFYNKHLERCNQKEQAYARNSELGGMNRRTYGSASDFEYQVKVDNSKRSLANYKNFDTKQFEGLLSPEQREQYYRERSKAEVNAKYAKIATTATATAGAVVVGGAAAVMMSYGGQQASANAASIGGMGTAAAVSGTSKVVQAISERDRKKAQSASVNEAVNRYKPKTNGTNSAPGNQNGATNSTGSKAPTRTSAANTSSNSTEAEQTRNSLSNFKTNRDKGNKEAKERIHAQQKRTATTSATNIPDDAKNTVRNVHTNSTVGDNEARERLASAERAEREAQRKQQLKRSKQQAKEFKQYLRDKKSGKYVEEDDDFDW